MSGMSVLSGLRASVESFPVWWAFPTAQSTMLDTTPQAHTAGIPVTSTSPPASRHGLPASPRFQHCSVYGFPLPCLRSCIPYAVASSGEERLGPPTFFDISLPACHGLRTPAGTFPSSPNTVILCCLRCTLKPSASATSAFSKLYQHFRGHGSPCGLQDLCLRFAHLVRRCLHGSAMDARLDTVGSSPLPDRDFHPARTPSFLGAITLGLSRWRNSGVG